MQAVLAARCDEMSELYSGLITHGVVASGHMRGSQPAVASPTEAGVGRGDKQRTTDAGVPCAHALWMMATRGAVREVRVPRRSQVTLDPSASVTYVTSLSHKDVVRCFADSRAEAPLRECELRPVAESETDALLLFGPFQEF